LFELLCLRVLFTVSVMLLLQSFSSIGNIQQAMAEQRHDLVTGTLLSRVSSPISSSSPRIINNNNSTTLHTASSNFLTYDNSTYGIKFQYPYGWNKIELLLGRITNVEFTSPAVNEIGGTQLPAEVVISIERGLGNVTSLGQYGEASDKVLHAMLGNFTSTGARPTNLSGQPAIARVLDIKQPTSGIHINTAQVFTLKDDKAYTITYTAPASRYLSYLPMVQQLINSFQITK
jgi:eukaryotic-like serine/threonine-protein kinase